MTEKKPYDTEKTANHGIEDESRRSVMKKGAIATGALALGLGSGSASAQQRDVLVYTNDYYPNVPFRIIQPLQQATTVQLLSRSRGGDISEISQPDDYLGYIIRYNLGRNGNGGKITTFVFLRGGTTLNVGSTRRFSGDASIFSSELNLLSTTLRR
jgi:hypothetical protein